MSAPDQPAVSAVPAAHRTTAVFAHSSRWSVFQKEATWRLTADALERAGGEPDKAPLVARVARFVLRFIIPWMIMKIEAGGPARFPFGDIVEMRLSFAPSRFDAKRHRCDIAMRDGSCATIWSTHYVSVGEFEDRAATYSPLVRALVAHVGAANPACDFRVGKRPLGYWLRLIFVLMAFSALAYMIMLVGSAAFSGIVIVKLVIIAAFVPLLVRYINKNRPGRFKPEAIPEDALP
jgi:hypothetical protein